MNDRIEELEKSILEKCNQEYNFTRYYTPDRLRLHLSQLGILIRGHAGTGAKVLLQPKEFVDYIVERFNVSEENNENLKGWMLNEINKEIELERKSNDNLVISEDSWMVRLIRCNFMIRKEKAVDRYEKYFVNPVVLEFHKGQIPSRLCPFFNSLLFSIIMTIIIPFPAILEFLTPKKINEKIWANHRYLFFVVFWMCILYLSLGMGALVDGLSEIIPSSLEQNAAISLFSHFILGLLTSIFLVFYGWMFSILHKALSKILDRISLKSIFKNPSFLENKKPEFKKSSNFSQVIKTRWKSWKKKVCPNIVFK